MENNLIDRQVAIDALKEHRALYCDNTPDTFSKLSYAEKSRVDELDTAIATLVNLPSAQPELIAQGAYVRGFEQGRTQGMLDAKLEPTCNQLATDTISRQAAIDALTHKWDGMVTSVFDVINSLPSAQPEKRTEKRTETHACDCIDRQAAIDALKGLPTWWADEGGYYGGAQPPMVALLDPEDAVSAIENLPSAQPEQRWIPFKTRPLTEEEKEEHPEWDCILDCKLPDNEQRILVAIRIRGHEEVQQDEFYSDDGSYLDSGYEIGTEAVAWMPLPEPYKEDDHETD